MPRARRAVHPCAASGRGRGERLTSRVSFVDGLRLEPENAREPRRGRLTEEGGLPQRLGKVHVLGALWGALRARHRAHEGAHDVCVAFARGVVHRALHEEAVDRQRVRPALEQNPHDVLVPCRRRPVQGADAVVRLGVGVGAARNQGVDHLGLPVLRRREQRRLARAVAQLGVGPALDEVLHDGQVPALRAVVQRRHLVHVGLVDVRGKLLHLLAQPRQVATPRERVDVAARHPRSPGPLRAPPCPEAGQAVVHA